MTIIIIVIIITISYHM